MQRFGSGIALLAFLLSAIAGCTSTLRTANLFGAKNKSSSEVTTIRLSGWQSNPAEDKLLSQLLKQFEAEHPNIRVKHEVINSQYMDVIKTRLIGDAAPDVFYLDAFEAPLLMKRQVLEPLDSYITPEFDIKDFQPVLLNAFKYNSKIYGLPKDFSTLALFYNKTAFAKAGIIQPPQTWDQLLVDSKKLTVDQNGDRKIDQYGFGINPELARQQFMIQAFGGQLMSADKAAFATPQSLKGLQLVIDQYRQDRTAVQPTDVGANSGGEVFGQGKVAMVIEGPWTIPYLQDTFPKLEFAIAEVPTVNGKAGTMAYTVAYVMNKKTPHKAAAWELIAYLTGKTGMKAWAKAGLALPARRSVLSELGYDQNPLYAPFVAGAEYATIWQAGENLPIVFTNFNNQFISALLGEQTLPQAMQRAQNTANSEIELSN